MPAAQHLAQLPNPAAYAKAWRRVVDARPDAWLRSPGWAGGVVRADMMRAEMMHALDRRINARGGMPEANIEMPIGLVRDARRLDDIKQRRIRIYQFESELCRRRFGHLLARHDD